MWTGGLSGAAGVTGSFVGDTGSSNGMTVYLRVGSPIWPMTRTPSELQVVREGAKVHRHPLTFRRLLGLVMPICHGTDYKGLFFL